MRWLFLVLLLPSCTVSVGGRFDLWQSEDRLEHSDCHELSRAEF